MSINRSIELQITSYLAGECSPSEKQVIDGLIQSDSDYKSAYAELAKIWRDPVLEPVSDNFDTDAAWVNISRHIDQSPLHIVHTKPNARRFTLKLVKYVAGIAAVAVAAFMVFQLTRTSADAMKTISSGTTITSPIELSDGSHIVLNSGSKVKFPEKFGSDSREVYFWGEAFFEIASDPTRPFVIETGDARIKVLGTSFNVKADKATGITEVLVNSGTVLFYCVDKNETILDQVVLHKGEKGAYNQSTGKLQKKTNDDPNTISWKTGILVFNNTPLDKVIAVIGNKYGVNIHMNDSGLAALKLTATFDNESLDSVLEVLSLVHKLQFTHNGNDYLVRKVTG